MKVEIKSGDMVLIQYSDNKKDVFTIELKQDEYGIENILMRSIYTGMEAKLFLLEEVFTKKISDKNAQ